MAAGAEAKAPPVRHGLSKRGRRILVAVAEALLCDEDATGALVPPLKATCARAADALSMSVGMASGDLRRGYAVLLTLIELLPLFVIGAPGRMSRLPLHRRVAYLEALETSRIGLLSMLFVAVKVPLCIPLFEEAEALALTGFDRPSINARRALAVLPASPDRSELPASASSASEART